MFGLALKVSIRAKARLVCRLSVFTNNAAYHYNRIKKPVGRNVPHGRTLNRQLGRIFRPPYTTHTLHGPGQPPESIQLDTALLDAMAKRPRSPRPSKKMTSKGTHRTVLQNGEELENWLNFLLHLTKSESSACEKASQNGPESFHLLRALKVNMLFSFLLLGYPST